MTHPRLRNFWGGGGGGGIFVHCAAGGPLARVRVWIWSHLFKCRLCRCLSAVCNFMSSFWSDACNTAVNKPLQALLDTSYASCGVTVSSCG